MSFGISRSLFWAVFTSPARWHGDILPREVRYGPALGQGSEDHLGPLHYIDTSPPRPAWSSGIIRYRAFTTRSSHQCRPGAHVQLHANVERVTDPSIPVNSQRWRKTFWESRIRGGVAALRSPEFKSRPAPGRSQCERRARVRSSGTPGEPMIPPSEPRRLTPGAPVIPGAL